MDIERLKDLKQQIRGSHDGINGDDLNLLYDLLPLVDEAIARQSVTSEEVQRVIDWLATGDFEIIAGDEEYIANSSHHPNTSRFRKTAIIALQAYQPTTRKNRTVEEVAEAIEYVNDWRKESMTFDRAVGILPPTSEETKAYETILTALQAYQPKGE